MGISPTAAFVFVLTQDTTQVNQLWMGHDWLDWTDFGLTVVGTIITVYALLLTFREARAARQRASEAKTAADAARDAAQAASRTLTERATLTDVASIRNGLQHVVSFVESGKNELALYELRAARQRLNELRERRLFQANKADVQSVVADLAALQTSIEENLFGGNGQGPSAALPIPEISHLLSKHIDTLSAWTEQLRFTSPQEP